MEDLVVVLSLGPMPLANALLSADELGEAEPRYALDLAFCRACALVQITETVAPEALFREYLYFSSFSDTMLRHARSLVDRLITERGLTPDSRVIELASNDGYLLQYYKQRGIPVLGIEPAANVAQAALRERGIPTLTEFFGLELARRLSGEAQQADAIHAHNVLAHVADLNGFVAGLGELLRPGGVAVIEVPYVREMIKRRAFDTIYHEHLCYFSLVSLERLFARHRLLIEHVEQVEIHGGSLRLFVGHPGDTASVRDSVAELREQERAWGADRVAAYEGFGREAATLRSSLLALLRDLKAQDRRIAGYGAAAKGTVLLNYAGLGPDTLEFVADRNPHKHGRYVPGVRVPILPAEALLEKQPDYALLLAWNLAGEVLEQQAEYRRRGGRFIVPIPELRIT
jgi:SAM-dependent methyltransferase